MGWNASYSRLQPQAATQVQPVVHIVVPSESLDSGRAASSVRLDQRAIDTRPSTVLPYLG